MAQAPCRRRIARCDATSAPKVAKVRCNARRKTSPRGRRSIARLPASPADRYHRGAALTDFDNREGAVQAYIEEHGVVEADVLVFGDGAQSPTRRRCLQ